MNQNNRAEERLPSQQECVLYNRFGFIKLQTVDKSKMGLGVETNRTLPFKNGEELIVVIPNEGVFPQGKVMWTKKDFNKTTRLGLKFLSAE